MDYTTKSSFGFQPNEAEIIVTIGLVGDDGKPVDLRVNELAGLNYSQARPPISCSLSNCYHAFGVPGARQFVEKKKKCS